MEWHWGGKANLSLRDDADIDMNGVTATMVTMTMTVSHQTGRREGTREWGGGWQRGGGAQKK